MYRFKPVLNKTSRRHQRAPHNRNHQQKLNDPNLRRNIIRHSFFAILIWTGTIYHQTKPPDLPPLATLFLHYCKNSHSLVTFFVTASFAPTMLPFISLSASWFLVFLCAILHPIFCTTSSSGAQTSPLVMHHVLTKFTR